MADSSMLHFIVLFFELYGKKKKKEKNGFIQFFLCLLSFGEIFSRFFFLQFSAYFAWIMKTLGIKNLFTVSGCLKMLDPGISYVVIFISQALKLLAENERKIFNVLFYLPLFVIITWFGESYRTIEEKLFKKPMKFKSLTLNRNVIKEKHERSNACRMQWRLLEFNKKGNKNNE